MKSVPQPFMTYNFFYKTNYKILQVQLNNQRRQEYKEIFRLEIVETDSYHNPCTA